MDPPEPREDPPGTILDLNDEQGEGIMFPLSIQEQEDGDRLVNYGLRRSSRRTPRAEISFKKICTIIIILFVTFVFTIAVFHWLAVLSHCTNRENCAAGKVRTATTTVHPRSKTLPGNTRTERSTSS